MKKLLTILLILSMLLSIAACGKKDTDNGNNNTDGGNTNAGGTTEENPDNDAPFIPSESYINGVKLDSYSIVYSDEDLDYAKRAAEYIQAQISTRTGIELAIVEDSATPTGEYEIVVGNTERAISERLNEDTDGLMFAMLVEEKQIALEGDYFIIAAAAYYFVETFVPTRDYSATVAAGATVHDPIVKEAKNYIVLIGDGMGVYHTQLHSIFADDSGYSDGEDLFYGYLLPYMGYSRTDSLSGITDSAAGGTAISCGTKTYNKHVGVDKDGNPLKSLTELSGELGKATAVMSTENKTGATPSTFSAHALDRNDTETILATQTSLVATYGTVIDCGYDYYTAKYMKVIEKHVTDTLTKVSADEDGFFLMYEEAYIDKHSSNGNMDKAYLALVRFNQVIARFMEFAFYNPDTFILITADHETGGIIVNEDGSFSYTTEEHTSANVPIFAYGMGAELFDGMTVENIQIGQTIASLMGVDNFGDQSVYQPLG